MPLLRRVLMIVIWCVGGFFTWMLIWLAAYAPIMIPEAEGAMLPRWEEYLGEALAVAGIIGMAVIPSVLAVLGIRGRLPGTRTVRKQYHGFPVDLL